MSAAPDRAANGCWVDQWSGVGGTGSYVRVQSHYMRRIQGVWTCIHCQATK